MRKTIIILFLLGLLSSNILAQVNLVPNPSFENFTWFSTVICDTNCICIDWYSPTNGTPDYDNKNTCAINLTPFNFFGYQLPHSGISYFGLAIRAITIYPQGFNDREYIQAKLTDTLKGGIKYCISFYVSLADSAQYACDGIGAYFSDTSVYNYDSSCYCLLLYNPQVYNPHGNIISDKQNWTLISGSFIAQGGEQYITIGNFWDDANTDTMYVGGASYHMGEPFSYYYLDDVSVVECSDTITPPSENEITIPNAFTPNGDMVNDVFKVKGKNIKILHGKIINRWGQELFKLDDVNAGWDGKYNGQYVSAGAYFYIIEVTFENGEKVRKTGSVELITDVTQ